MKQTKTFGIILINDYASFYREDEEYYATHPSIPLHHSFYGFILSPSHLEGSKAVAATYTYDAFGNLMSRAGSLSQPFQFSTKPYDEQTGLSYFGYRFYSPVIGRWVTRDPIGYAGGLNLYGYTNDPVNRIDPLGLYDYLDFFIDSASFVAGFGDAFTFGLSTKAAGGLMYGYNSLRQSLGMEFRDDEAAFKRTVRCSKAFKGGQVTGLVWAVGRLAYAGIAKGASMGYAARGANLGNAEKAVAFRNILKGKFRLNLSDARFYTLNEQLEKYAGPTVIEEVIAASGRTNLQFNIHAGLVYTRHAIKVGDVEE